MSICIWCKRENTTTSIEHIIPEALGCPDDFILSDGLVCKKCNNGMGHLDRAVIDEFELLALMAGVPRKKGRRPKIQSRGNLRGTIGPDGYVLSINMEKHPVIAYDGQKLGAFGKSDRNVKASFVVDGDVATVSFATTLGANPKFVRGIVKIAFSSFAHFLFKYSEKHELVYSEYFDPVRKFVLRGQGDRRLLLLDPGDKNYFNTVSQPFVTNSGEHFVHMRLTHLEFIVDLSPELACFYEFRKELQCKFGNNGWGQLPLDK